VLHYCFYTKKTASERYQQRNGAKRKIIEIMIDVEFLLSLILSSEPRF